MTKVVINKTPTSITRFSETAVEWLRGHGYDAAAATIENDAASIERDNEALVAVTEALGFDAGYASCHPTVVEVPDSADWYVGSKMQREVIIEEHRTWP